MSEFLKSFKMKKIILLFVFAICASLSYGQFKVTADGINHALNKQLWVGEDVGTATALVEIGRARSSAGNAGVRFFTGAGGANSNFNFVAQSNGLSRLRHFTPQDFEITSVNSGQIVLRTQDTPRMFIRSSGQVDISGPATVNGGMSVTSDKRLKSNVTDFNLGIDELMQLNPVKYRYTGEADTYTGREFVGLVAQEVEKVLPDFIGVYKHEIRDDEGLVIDEKDYLKIHDSELKFVMINAIKDQQKMIEAQADKIALLEDAIVSNSSTGAVNSTNVTLSSYDLAELNQNTPNPFNGSTSVDYIIPTNAQNSQIRIFGKTGQLMKSLNIDHVGQGTLNIDANDLPSGTYSYQLVVDGRSVKTNKMVVAK